MIEQSGEMRWHASMRGVPATLGDARVEGHFSGRPLAQERQPVGQEFRSMGFRRVGPCLRGPVRCWQLAGERAAKDLCSFERSPAVQIGREAGCGPLASNFVPRRNLGARMSRSSSGGDGLPFRLLEHMAESRSTPVARRGEQRSSPLGLRPWIGLGHNRNALRGVGAVTKVARLCSSSGWACSRPMSAQHHGTKAGRARFGLKHGLVYGIWRNSFRQVRHGLVSLHGGGELGSCARGRHCGSDPTEVPLNAP